VDRQQHLLKNVLDVAIRSSKPAAQKAPEVQAQIVEKRAIRRRVTLEPRAQKLLQALLLEQQ
jgi:hypothetical protein